MSLSWSKADSVIYLPPPTFQSFLLNRLLIFLLPACTQFNVYHKQLTLHPLDMGISSTWYGSLRKLQRFNSLQTFSTLVKSLGWFHIYSISTLGLDTHLLRNGTSWARLLWTDTRVAASISRETFSHSSLHSALSQGPWWRPLEFVRATPFLWFFSKVICDICCPVIANSDMALERMLGLSPATSPATTSNGSSTKTT